MTYKLWIGSAYNPKQVIAEDTKSIRQLYEENDVNLPAAAMVTLNSRRLGDAELTAPISTLNLTSGDSITITEKYGGARV